MPPPDNRRRFPDEAHEAVAAWVEEALSDLKVKGKAIGNNSSDLGDVLLLVDALFGLLDQTMADALLAAVERAQLRADHDTLAATVAGLQTAVTALTAPELPGGLL